MPPKKKPAKRKAPARKLAKKRPVRKAPRKLVKKTLRKAGRKPARKYEKKPTRKSARVQLQYPREPQCKEVENLYGPIELDILEHPQTGVRIVLLGDRHVNERKCPPGIRCGVPIWTYLENVFKQFRSRDKDDFLDFFVEMEFSEEQRAGFAKLTSEEFQLFKRALSRGDTISNHLSSVGIYFNNCLQRVKEQCEFYGKRIRFHYSDVREGVIHKQIGEADKAIVQELQKVIREGQEQEKVKEWHIQFILKLLDKFEQKDIDYFFRIAKIDKQLRKIDDKTLIPLFYEYMENNMKEYRSFSSQSLQRMANEMLTKLKMGNLPTAQFGERDETFAKLVYHVLAILFAPLFDIYTLARMMRFKMKHVIIYAGAAHTEVMKLFLVDKLNYLIVASKKSDIRESDSHQCISLKDTPQPWFP